MSNIAFTPDLMIPVAGIIFGTLMIVLIVGITFWFKAREKELQVHQEMRLREMDHQLKMKELELQIEKARSERISERVA